MGEFQNPYLDPREEAPGELAQEYASLLLMASFFLGIELTDQEKKALPIIIGAVMRERNKISLDKLKWLLETFGK